MNSVETQTVALAVYIETIALTIWSCEAGVQPPEGLRARILQELQYAADALMPNEAEVARVARSLTGILKTHWDRMDALDERGDHSLN